MPIDKAEIQSLAQMIGEIFQPECVILFGSYAYGTPTDDSDVDLLVIMDHSGRNSEQAVEILHRVGPRIPVDLLVRTPREVKQRLSWNDFFSPAGD